MTTVTLRPTSNSGSIQSDGNTYAQAAGGTYFKSINANGSVVGQAQSGSTYECIEQFLEYDLPAVIPAAATITSIVMKAKGSTTGTDTIYWYPYDYGSLTTADWRPPQLYSGYVAYVAGAALSTSSYTNFTVDAGMNTAVSRTGKTRLFAITTKQQQGSPPSGFDQISFGVVSGVADVVLDITYTLPAPTVTAVSPNAVLTTDGGPITITGTGFLNNSAGTNTVTIGGTAATGVTVVSDTTITCTAAAHVSGQTAITVTNNNGSNAASVNLYYVKVRDNIVKLVKGGTVVGDNKADTATDWPIAETAVDYVLWDSTDAVTLAADDVNASDFGIVLSATVDEHSRAMVDYAEVTVYYQTPGVSDPGSYLVALQVSQDKTTATPEVYKLPRSGFTVGQDDTIIKATSGVNFYTPRMYAPNRSVSKTYRAIEFWLEMTPETNTPGLQVWASVNGGTYFQLLDSSGDAATLMTTGGQRLFFPATSSAVGNYVQLRFTVPALGTGQVGVQPVIRDLAIRASLRPVKTIVAQGRLVLGAGEFEDRGTMRATVKEQKRWLEGMLGADSAPIAFRDPVTGENGYMELIGLVIQEAVVPGASEATWLADVQLRKTFYGE